MEKIQESLIEQLEKIINNADIKRFQDVRKYMKQDVPSQPSQRETARNLVELDDPSISEEEKNIMIEYLEAEYDILKTINDHQLQIPALVVKRLADNSGNHADL